MDTKQIIQDEEYQFPYHHIPQYKNGNFSQTVELYWGYEYLSYIQFLVSFLKNEKFKNLIDIGCGDGRLLSELRKTVPHTKLVGVDYSGRAIALAKSFEPEIDYRVETAGSFSNTEMFDIGCLIEVIEHIPLDDIPNFVKDIAARIKPGGLLVLTTPTENIPVNRKHYQHFTEDKLKEIFSKYMTLENIYYLNDDSILSHIIQHLLSNRLFSLRGKVAGLLYKLYTTQCLHSTKFRARRICCIFKKNNNETLLP